MKKTVREQLQELRTSDSVFEGVNETEGKKYNRARKKKSSSDSQGMREVFVSQFRLALHMFLCPFCYII